MASILSQPQCVNQHPHQWVLSFSALVNILIHLFHTTFVCECDCPWRYIKLKCFPHYWHFVRGIHRSPVNSPHKGQWRGTLMFSLISVWINDWVNNYEASDLRRYHAHYVITVMYFRLFRDNKWVTCLFQLLSNIQWNQDILLLFSPHVLLHLLFPPSKNLYIRHVLKSFEWFMKYWNNAKRYILTLLLCIFVRLTALYHDKGNEWVMVTNRYISMYIS